VPQEETSAHEVYHLNWYRHRIVKRRLIKDVRFASDPRVSEALVDLRRQAQADVGVYLRTHHPAQQIKTEFVSQRAEGLEVFVAVTLFGPPDLQKEILTELAERGEI